MKKIISILLCVVLMVSLIPAAFADAGTKVDSTKHTEDFDEIVKAIKDAGYEYEVSDREADRDEHVDVKVTADDFDSFKWVSIDLYYNEEFHRVQLLAFYVVDYDENLSDGDFFQLLMDVNSANYEYNYVKFYCDTEYCSVDAEFSAYAFDDAGETAVNMLETMAHIIDTVYTDTLYKFDNVE